MPQYDRISKMIHVKQYKIFNRTAWPNKTWRDRRKIKEGKKGKQERWRERE